MYQFFYYFQLNCMTLFKAAPKIEVQHNLDKVFLVWIKKK